MMASAAHKVVETPLTKALNYTALGYAIMPIRPASKVPLLNDWQHKASCDASQVRDWWQRFPNAGIGVHCGLSGLVVVDVDPRNGGRETLARLQSERGPLWDYACGIARTGGGGSHYVFRMPEGVGLPGKAGPGVDILTGNRYFIVEPSIHPLTGRRYVWEKDCCPASMPELDFLPDAWCAWPEVAALPSDPADALANLPPQPLEDTPENRERVKSAAAALSPDCEYPEWMRIVFAILATGLPDAMDIAREWSEGAPDRFDDRAFETLVRSYKDDRRGGDLIGPGTLFHLAKREGWVDPKPGSRADDGLGERRFQVIPAHEFTQAGPVSWLVRNLLQRDGLGVLYGEPGSGKSFLVLDLSGAIARGAEWRGLPVTCGPVVYVVAEGAGGFRKRLEAYAQHHGVDLAALPIGVIADAPNFLRDDDRPIARAVEAYGGAVLIVVDTLASVTPGGNENAAEDMGAVIGRCKRLQAETGAFVLLVHHSGKDSGRGARGWSGLRGAVDLEIEITRNGEDRAAKVTKQKDGEDGEAFPFRLSVVDLGPDAEGNPSTSCVVEHVDSMPEGAKRQPAGTVQKIVYQVVRDFGPCSVDDVLKMAVDRMVHDPEKHDRRREHARRAIENLMTAKFLTRDHSGVLRLYGEVSAGWDIGEADGEPLFEGDS
jgi:AAA domain-containing protein/bifunctional DNA primase/polymerase-like protein/primase-like protein